MNVDLFEQLAETPVPPPPAAFNAALHERLNQRLVLGQLIDFATRGLGFALLHFLVAVGGLVRLTVTGKFMPDSKDRNRHAP